MMSPVSGSQQQVECQNLAKMVLVLVERGWHSLVVLTGKQSHSISYCRPGTNNWEF